MNISTSTKQLHHISLFPMFNILVCTLGVMIFILIAVVTVSLGVGKTVTIVPDITDRHGVPQKTPVFVEWDGRNMIFHPSRQAIHFEEDLQDLGTFQNIYIYIDEKVRLSSLKKVFDEFQVQGGKYIVVLLRPSGFHNFLGLRGYFETKGVEVGYEPIDQDCKIRVNGDVMYRKNRKKNLIDIFNLDSLMDILTCTVGMMFFIIMFAVMDAQSVSISKLCTMATDPPSSSERKLFLCQNGKIRPFAVDDAIEELFSGQEIIYENVPAIVKQANEKNVTDGFFDYRLAYDEWSDAAPHGYANKYRSISLIVHEKSDITGETAGQLNKRDSDFLQRIEQMDAKRVWVAFSVDEHSIEVFRKARELCKKRGIVTGWEPWSFKFPYREVILGGGDRDIYRSSIFNTIQ